MVIAWTVARPGVTHALVGARTVEQSIENAGAGRVELDQDDAASITDLVNKFSM